MVRVRVDIAPIIAHAIHELIHRHGQGQTRVRSR